MSTFCKRIHISTLRTTFEKMRTICMNLAIKALQIQGQEKNGQSKKTFFKKLLNQKSNRKVSKTRESKDFNRLKTFHQTCEE